MAQTARKMDDSGIINFFDFCETRQDDEQESAKAPKLKKDGTPKNTVCNKKRGRKSEVYTLEIADMKKIIRYFEDTGRWIHYLLFVMSCNMARRVGDTLNLRWCNFFHADGSFRRDIFEIVEDKTDKLANPHINSAVRAAIQKYIEMTGCDPAANEYQNYVFLQLSGTHKGALLSYSAYMKALKKAGEEVGVEYNIGTHSPRKTFGMMSRMLHPNDYDSMELLQTVFNHSDTKTTKHYIGLTKKKIDQYYDDMGAFFDAYVTGDQEYIAVSDKPIISIDVNDMRDLLMAAIKAGFESGENGDPASMMDKFNEMMEMLDTMRK